MSEIKKLNVCQYWSIGERVVCEYWDNENTSCTYENKIYKLTGDFRIEKGQYAPYCNLIGTHSKCRHYKGIGVKDRCVLPDPSRHVCNRKTGKKWVYFRDDKTWSFSDISGYNNGNCNGNGTLTTCSGYAPKGLSYGKVGYTADPDADIDGFTIDKEIGFRLPLGFEVYNKRAELSRCYWWKHDVVAFEIDPDSGKIKEITSYCKCPDALSDEYTTVKFDEELGMYRAPCNGAKPECPNYTGNCWNYCIDSKMRYGDKVLAEQILELRYYIRKEQWDLSIYKNIFKDPEIYAFDGLITFKVGADYYEEDYTIGSVYTYISDFEPFSIEHKKIPLTAGTSSKENKVNYPTLIRKLDNLPLRPIIRNKFDKDNQNNNVFEACFIKHKYLLIFGDMFWYNSKTYGINLSDPDLNFMPFELQVYDNMDAIKAAKSDEEYEIFYTNLELLLYNLSKYSPEKITESEFGNDENLFYLNMPTFWGNNNIIIFNKGSSVWEYDKIQVKKQFCGGVIGQTSFIIEGDGKTIDYLPSYESDFSAHINNNGKIEFQFFPYKVNGDISATTEYIYNDSVSEKLSLFGPTVYEMCYKLYKVDVYQNVQLRKKDIRFFGNSGYTLVSIPDDYKKLSHVIKPWETDEKLKLILVNEDGEEYKINMEIYEIGTDRLEVNQMIIRPKNKSEFKQPCSESDILMVLDHIYVYEKRSFGEVPEDSHEEVDDDFVAGSSIQYRHTAEINKNENIYELTKFGIDTLLISAIFKGNITGRIKGNTRTKMIVWIRQPYCKDVEISYIWGSLYRKSILLPMYYMYGEMSYDVDPQLYEGSYTPPCGDHSLGGFSEKGPMWYPYDACEDYAYYECDQITAKIMADISYKVMEVFDPESNNPEHGRFDMRMLGPCERYGGFYDVHATIWACREDWSWQNLDKVNSHQNTFVGKAMYRGGLGVADLEICTKGGGIPPKFGNVIRGFLRSYRAIDNVWYYKITEGGLDKRKKWMPMYEFYTKADITDKNIETKINLYTKDIVSPYIYPMGLMRIDNTIENIDVNEQIDGGEKSPIRYRFEDVFRVHESSAELIYPAINNTSEKVYWFTYKDYSGAGAGGSGSKSIQWAWQEIWKDLERMKNKISDFKRCILSDIICCKNLISDSIEGINLPYLENSEGRHIFLDIRHPSYLYSSSLEEHRLVCEEGSHIITLIPPDFSISEDGEMNKFFWLTLDSGPQRAFDIYGNWDPDGSEDFYPDEENKDLYKECTVDPWTTAVSLFEAGASKSKTLAETDNRVVETHDGMGQEVKTYYNRGLDIRLLSGSFNELPKETELVSFKEYEVSFSIQAEKDDDNLYTIVDINKLYPSEQCFNLIYSCDNEYLEIEFKIKKTANMGAISKAKCSFLLGAEKIENNEELPSGLWNGTLYHLPPVEIYLNGDLEYSCDQMKLATKDSGLETKECFYDLELTAEKVMTQKIEEAENRDNDEETFTYLKFKFRLKPTDAEIADKIGLIDYYGLATNIVNIKCIYIYGDNFVEAKEPIIAWERRYNISYGGHGDFPPHGYDSTESLLSPVKTELSTVYQQDSINGVVGMPNSNNKCKTMNKCRGRILQECSEDGQEVLGNDLYSWEAEQKKIHDEVVQSGSTEFSMISICPPGLKPYLDDMSIEFPKWTCNFINTFVLLLTEVKQYESYNAEGFYIDWDVDGTRPCHCGRGVIKDIRDHVLRWAATDTIAEREKNSAIWVYYNMPGVGQYLTDPNSSFKGIGELTERMERIATNRTGLALPAPASQPY